MAPGVSPVDTESPLSEAERARGRRLAWSSHSAAMTHRFVFTQDLPTLALISLGASEFVLGVQRSLERFAQILQLPTLRAVGFARKRSILIAGQALAVAGGLPLVAFAWLGGLGDLAIPVALASLALVCVGIVVAQTVWFPMLRGFVEPARIGSFFGILRTIWHVALIVYFLAAQRWLAAHPGSFGVLFGAATLLGLARIGLLARFPEAEGERGTNVRIREAFALLRGDARMRRYLAGMSLAGAAHRAVLPFAVVWMRRVMGLSDGEVVLLATVAQTAGGLVSLYPFGRLVDRAGPWPVFRGTGLALACLFALLLLLSESSSPAALVAFFFLAAVLVAGFGVADTHLLFSLTPVRAPSRHLVVADVTTSLAYGFAPLAAGALLDVALARGVAPVEAYRGLFAVGALLAALSLAPLRHFRR
jgi:hypothetical protein